MSREIMHLPYVTLPPIDLGAIGLGKLDWFAIFVFAAIVVGVALYDRMVARGGDIDLRTARLMPEAWIVGGFIVAHLVHVVFYRPELMREDAWVIVKIWAGISSIGGFAGALAATVLVGRRHEQPLLPYTDRGIAACVVAWIFGRLGCAVSHDHPGARTDFFLAVQYPDGVRHDLGLYELLLTALVLTPSVLLLTRRPWRTGMPTGLVLTLYGVARFFLDFLRATDRDGVDPRYSGLTLAQYGAVLMVGAGLFLVARARRGGALQPPLWGAPAKGGTGSCAVHGR